MHIGYALVPYITRVLLLYNIQYLGTNLIIHFMHAHFCNFYI